MMRARRISSQFIHTFAASSQARPVLTKPIVRRSSSLPPHTGKGEKEGGHSFPSHFAVPAVEENALPSSDVKICISRFLPHTRRNKRRQTWRATYHRAVETTCKHTIIAVSGFTGTKFLRECHSRAFFTPLQSAARMSAHFLLPFFCPSSRTTVRPGGGTRREASHGLSERNRPYTNAHSFWRLRRSSAFLRLRIAPTDSELVYSASRL